MQSSLPSRLFRSASRLGSALLLGGSLLAAACETTQFCSEDECAEDGGGGDKPTGGKPGSGEKPGTGGKSGGRGTGGFAGALNGAGGAFGGMAGAEATGGKSAGTGGEIVDPGTLGGKVEEGLIDVLPGGTAQVTVSLQRGGGFDGTVLVSFDGEPFTGTKVFATPSKNQVTLTIEAEPETEQGYYDASVIAESSDGDLSIELPVTVRVRGAPGTLDLTFGDREMPWVGEGTDAEVAVDDAGFIYLRNQETIFRFNERGFLDESFEPEGLAEELGPMIGMEDGVLVTSSSGSSQVLHILGSGKKYLNWTGQGFFPDWGAPLSLDSVLSLHRNDEKVAVSGDYAYPACDVQLFSKIGEVDTNFVCNNLNAGIARVDSQGRVIVAGNINNGSSDERRKLVRYLSSGDTDLTFGNEGALVLSGTDPIVLDFEVLSDDGLAILTKDDAATRLVIWTPSDAGGVLQYYLLEQNPSSLVVASNDQLLALETVFDRQPSHYAYLFTPTGELITSFGKDGRLNLDTLLTQRYEALPAFDRFYVNALALDATSNRFIVGGADLGRLYFCSIWL